MALGTHGLEELFVSILQAQHALLLLPLGSTGSCLQLSRMGMWQVMAQSCDSAHCKQGGGVFGT
jgi:hypothetical protein